MNHNNLALQLGAFRLPTAEEAIRAAQALGVGAIGFSGIPRPFVERESHRQILMSVTAPQSPELEVVTVHAGLPAKNVTMDEFRSRLVQALQSLGEGAAAANTRIALENWRYPADPIEHLRILESVAHPVNFDGVILFEIAEADFATAAESAQRL